MIDAVLAEIIAIRDPHRAAWDAAYLKLPPLVHHGASAAFARDLARRHVPRTGAASRAFADAAWSTDVWDLRAVAVVALMGARRDFGPEDLPWCEALLRRSHTWAVVDAVAVHVVGDILRRHPETVGALDRWSTDPDFWIRRSAMLALLLPLRRTGRTDAERLLRWADAHARDPEWFLRKAAGWALREFAKREPDLVEAWLMPRLARLGAVTFREVVKGLPAERAGLLVDAWTVARKRPTVQRVPAAGS